MFQLAYPPSMPGRGAARRQALADQDFLAVVADEIAREQDRLSRRGRWPTSIVPSNNTPDRPEKGAVHNPRRTRRRVFSPGRISASRLLDQAVVEIEVERPGAAMTSSAGASPDRLPA